MYITSVENVCKTVKRRVAPSQSFRAVIRAKAEQIKSAVDRECKKAGLTAEVRIDGSVAKDTWLRDKADADIFMRVSPDLSKDQLRDICLPIAKRALAPNKVVERYAEHPYIESTVKLGKQGALRINVVPCYRVRQGEWLSATDRSPFHTEFVQQHLAKAQRDEVRLLKAFLRGIGAYGAEIRTGGFSGMLCETLIISHGSFLNVIKQFSRWQEARVVDLENHLRGRIEEAHRLFHEPLIVIDPVDGGRNLAAAVRKAQLWNFVAASRQLLDKPSTTFFNEPEIEPITVAGYRRMAKLSGFAVLGVVLGRMDVVIDVLWSQLYKTERAIVNVLESNGFSVVRSASWSDEQSISVILLQLAQAVLPASRTHTGPPVSRSQESASFLAKHLADKRTVAGPWIASDRWVVQRERNFASAAELLNASLRNGGRAVGVASEPERIFRAKLEIVDDKGIERLIASNPEFAKVVRAFLAGRPAWLG